MKQCKRCGKFFSDYAQTCSFCHGELRPIGSDDAASDNKSFDNWNTGKPEEKKPVSPEPEQRDPKGPVFPPQDPPVIPPRKKTPIVPILIGVLAGAMIAAAAAFFILNRLGSSDGGDRGGENGGLPTETPPVYTESPTGEDDDNENAELMSYVDAVCSELDNARSSGSYEQVNADDITGWLDGDTAAIVHESSSSGYDKTWYCENGEPVFAEYEGDDTFRFYLQDGEIVCFEYWEETGSDDSTIYTSSQNTDQVLSDFYDAVDALNTANIDLDPDPGPSVETETETSVSPASHHYEIYMSDCTWWEAKAAAESKGGYLACITSQEEFDTVSALATQQQYALNSDKSLYLWLGGSRSESSDPTTYYWLTGETIDLNSGLWYSESEPSYYDIIDTNGGRVNECYICMWRAKKDDVDIGWTLNDQRNDLPSVFDTILGRIGYVVEYDY